MRLLLSLHQLYLAVSLPVLARAAICNTIIINSQEDAKDTRTACTNITGDLVLGSEASGEIILDGITNIFGSLRNDGDSAITSISSSTLSAIWVNAAFQGLSSLQSIAFPNLITVGTPDQDRGIIANGSVVLEDLPALETTNLEGLTNIGEYHVIALPKWTEDECGLYERDIQTSQGPSVIEIRDVAFQGPYGPCVLITQTNVDSITISGYAHPTISLYQNSTKSISITGDGNSSVKLGTAFIGSAAISGTSSLTVDVVTKNAIDELEVRNSTFEFIDQYLREYHPIRALVIDNNPNLTKFPNYELSWFDWTVVSPEAGPIYDSIELRGVPSLYLHPNSTHLTNDTNVDGFLNKDWYNGYCTTGRACMANMTSVIIDGNITNDFFEDFIFAFWSNASRKSFWSDAENKIDIRYHGRVWERFEINSTDPTFNCARIDRLRDVGLFPGEYSCNGKTVPVTRDAWAAAAKDSSATQLFIGWVWTALTVILIL
ncbi:hypothetical protein GQX73_g7769 [Xylaria multiplex]|uniref:FAS1 domain-containing protein n=1 Tax=Xylaria multiplex TaxID=323545 RepID=A0A7C8MNU7_9PEZI|nr:hypothetical protein GQX73_g7769 [Xylaria multiplex]